MILGIAYLLLAAAFAAAIVYHKSTMRIKSGDFAYWCSIVLLLAAIGLYWLIWG